VLQVERAIHASPDVDRVKHLENVFAAIVQMAIAQQKTLSTQRQVKAMVPRKCVRRELSTSAIQSATPFFPVRSYPERHSLVDLGVSERFLSSFVPAKASKRGQPTAQALLQVPAKTILGCRTKRMIRDVRNSRFTVFKLLNRYAIVPHIRVIDVAHQPDHSVSVREETLAQFEFDIFRTGAGKIPLQVNKVCLPGHQRFRKPDTPIVVFEIEHRPNCVPSRVCRVIVGSIVVDGEIQKLEMAIASGRVQIEKIHELEFAQPDFQPSCG
jgi:hypothetical protein